MAYNINKYKTAAVVLAACLLPAALVLADVEIVQGRAYDDQGRLAYLERHTITYRNGHILKIKTVYTDADHVPIAKTESDFSKNRELGNYDFRDDRPFVGSRVAGSGIQYQTMGQDGFSQLLKIFGQHVVSSL